MVMIVDGGGNPPVEIQLSHGPMGDGPMDFLQHLIHGLVVNGYERMIGAPEQTLAPMCSRPFSKVIWMISQGGVRTAIIRVSS